MRGYITDGRLTEGLPDGATFSTPEHIDPRRIKLADRKKPFPLSPEENREMFMRIAMEEGEMDFSEPTHTASPRTLGRRIRRAYDAIAVRAIRIWLWNIKTPILTWYRMKYRRTEYFSNDATIIRALIRDAFIKEGIDLHGVVQDNNTPSGRDKGGRGKPGRYDLFFNRKRVHGA